MNNILDTVINAFSDFGAAIFTIGEWLLYTLLAIEIAMVGWKAALGKDNDIGSLLLKVIYYGFVIWIYDRLPGLAVAAVDSIEGMVSTVLEVITNAAGAPVISEITPGNVITRGWQLAGAPMTENEWGFFKNLANIDVFIIRLLVMFFTFLTFLVMALQLMLAHIELHIILAFSPLIIPWLVFEPTKFIGSKIFAAVVGSVVKVGLIFFTVGVLLFVASEYYSIDKWNSVRNHSGTYQSRDDIPDWIDEQYIHEHEGQSDVLTGRQTIATYWTVAVPNASYVILLEMLGVAFLFLFLSQQIPALASQLLTGIPNLGATGLLGQVAAATFLGSKALGGAANALRGGAAGVRGGMNMANGGPMGQSPPRGSMMGAAGFGAGVVGGLAAGAAKAAGAAAGAARMAAGGGGGGSTSRANGGAAAGATPAQATQGARQIENKSKIAGYLPPPQGPSTAGA